jgi:predicted dehydrogenase
MNRKSLRCLATGFLAGFALLAQALAATSEEKKAAPLRAGMIGLDTSHVQAFAQLLNSPSAQGEFAGVKIVAAYPGGSPDIPASKDRLEGFTQTLRDKFNVEIVDSIDALLGKVDVIFLESVDGRPHLEQARPVLKAKKPLFIDKPMAGSLADVLQIFDLARETGTPVFSSSATRFAAASQSAREMPRDAKARVTSTSPCSLEPHHPDLFWYGVHGVEALYAIMGPGCETVTRTHSEKLDEVKGTWKDGRTGTFRGTRPGGSYTAELVGADGTKKEIKTYDSYKPLVAEIVKFFKTGKAPVPPEETIELFAFMEAADESKRQGGSPVKLADVLAKARSEIGRKAASGK